MMTAGPWIFIFGVMIVCVHFVAPSLVYLFANVYGYYYVYGDADKLIKEQMHQNTDLTKKIYTTPARFINYITSENFEETYNELIKEGTVLDKAQLLKIVKERERVGIMAWYLHTGVFAILVVEHYISTYACH